MEFVVDYPGVNKHTHPEILSVECKLRTRTSCGEKPSDVVAENMFFILNTIISLTQVTSWGRGGSPSCCIQRER